MVGRLTLTKPKRSKSRRGRSKSTRGKTVEQLKKQVQARCASPRVTHGKQSKRPGSPYTKAELAAKIHTCAPKSKSRRRRGSKSRRRRGSKSRRRGSKRRGSKRRRRGSKSRRRGSKSKRRGSKKCRKHTSKKGPLRCRSVAALKTYIRRRCKSGTKIGGKRSAVLSRARSCRKKHKSRK